MTVTDRAGHEVVLHVSDHPEHLARAVAAGASLAQDDPELEVRVIVHGAALEGVTSAAEPVTPANEVRVEACRIGLERRGITEDQLQSSVNTVASAVVAMVQAQRGGASYIRF